MPLKSAVEIEFEKFEGVVTAPQPRFYHIALFDSSINSLVVTCGRDGSDYFSDLHFYNLTTSTWSTTTTTGDKPPYTCGVGWLCGQHLWLFGGYGYHGNSNSVYKCNINNGQWERVKQTGSVPSPRSDFVLWQHNKNVVIFGGFADKPNNLLIQNEEWVKRRNNQVFVLDHTTTPPHWSHPQCIGARPTPRNSCVYTQVDNSGYLFGGLTSQDLSYDFFSFNLDTFTWASITTTGSVPSERDGSAMVMLNDEELFLCGGDDEDGKVLSDCFILNLKTMRWREVEVPTFQPVCYHTLTRVDDGKLLLFGGIDESRNTTNTLGCFEYDSTAM